MGRMELGWWRGRAVVRKMINLDMGVGFIPKEWSGEGGPEEPDPKISNRSENLDYFLSSVSANNTTHCTLHKTNTKTSFPYWAS